MSIFTLTSRGPVEIHVSFKGGSLWDCNADLVEFVVAAARTLEDPREGGSATVAAYVDAGLPRPGTEVGCRSVVVTPCQHLALSYHESKLGLNGPSKGLATALAFALGAMQQVVENVAEEIPANFRIFATGCVDDDGNVSQVEDFARKVEELERYLSDETESTAAKCVMLVPRDDEMPIPRADGIDIFPVSSLREAFDILFQTWLEAVTAAAPIPSESSNVAIDSMHLAETLELRPWGVDLNRFVVNPGCAVMARETNRSGVKPEAFLSWANTEEDDTTRPSGARFDRFVWRLAAGKYLALAASEDVSRFLPSQARIYEAATSDQEALTQVLLADETGHVLRDILRFLRSPRVLESIASPSGSGAARTGQRGTAQVLRMLEVALGALVAAADRTCFEGEREACVEVAKLYAASHHQPLRRMAVSIIEQSPLQEQWGILWESLRKVYPNGRGHFPQHGAELFLALTRQLASGDQRDDLLRISKEIIAQSGVFEEVQDAARRVLQHTEGGGTTATGGDRFKEDIRRLFAELVTGYESVDFLVRELRLNGPPGQEIDRATIEAILAGRNASLNMNDLSALDSLLSPRGGLHGVLPKRGLFDDLVSCGRVHLFLGERRTDVRSIGAVSVFDLQSATGLQSDLTRARLARGLPPPQFNIHVHQAASPDKARADWNKAWRDPPDDAMYLAVATPVVTYATTLALTKLFGGPNRQIWFKLPRPLLVTLLGKDTGIEFVKPSDNNDRAIYLPGRSFDDSEDLKYGVLFARRFQNGAVLIAAAGTTALASRATVRAITQIAPSLPQPDRVLCAAVAVDVKARDGKVEEIVNLPVDSSSSDQSH